MSGESDRGDPRQTSASSDLGIPKPPYTARGFIEASRRFAHAAAEEYSPRDSPFFFLHVGASIELLLKAALCAASPALLLDWRQVNDDSLIRLVGYSRCADNLSVAVQTAHPTGRPTRSGSPRRWIALSFYTVPAALAHRATTLTC